MFDLSAQEKIPGYQVKLETGEVRNYDSILIAYKLRILEGVSDPEEITKVLSQAFDIPLTSFQAMALLQDFMAFAAENVEGPLKNVLPREPSSATTMDSRPEPSIS